MHWIGGVEHELGGAMSGRVEAYYKTFDRLIVGRLESAAETATRVAQYDFPASLASSVPSSSQITTQPGNGASGNAYGVEAYFARRPTSARDMVSGWTRTRGVAHQSTPTAASIRSTTTGATR